MQTRLIALTVQALCLTFIVPPLHSRAQGLSSRPAPKRTFPGPKPGGTLLPNGWTITPEGAQIPVSDLPLNMVISPDGNYLLVTTNGDGDQTIEVIDLANAKSLQTLSVKKSWLGIAFAPGGKRLFVSGGDDNEILAFDFAAGHATQTGKILLGSSEYHALNDRQRDEARRSGRGEYAFPAGLAVTPDGRQLYAAENLTHKVAVVDLSAQLVISKIPLGEYP